MKLGNDEKNTFIARSAQGISLHAIYLRGYKNSGAVFSLTWKSLTASHFSSRVCDRPQSKLKERFFFAGEFIRERNGLRDISMTNNFPKLNGLRL
jgi:hypothetical protein